MATKAPADEKFQNIDFDLFDALSALDKKDYGYLDRLTEEQRKKFVPYMMTHWMSAVKGASDIQGYYLLSVEAAANKHLFNEHVMKHPKLQWLMLCASGLGAGKHYHQWIPQLSKGTRELKETPNKKDVKEYYKKIYPKTDDAALDEFSKQFVEEQKKKVYLAKRFPSLKKDDIETLALVVTDEDINQYEKDNGND
jgi:hypothetical protein